MQTDTDGETDRYDEANSRFSQFCDRAYNTKCYVLLRSYGKTFNLTVSYLGLPYKRNTLLSFHCNERPIWLNNKIKYLLLPTTRIGIK